MFLVFYCILDIDYEYVFSGAMDYKRRGNLKYVWINQNVPHYCSHTFLLEHMYASIDNNVFYHLFFDIFVHWDKYDNIYSNGLGPGIMAHFVPKRQGCLFWQDWCLHSVPYSHGAIKCDVALLAVVNECPMNQPFFVSPRQHTSDKTMIYKYCLTVVHQ